MIILMLLLIMMMHISYISMFVSCTIKQKQSGGDDLACVISAGQETAKQALQEIVILPALRPEVHDCRLYVAVLLCSSR